MFLIFKDPKGFLQDQGYSLGHKPLGSILHYGTAVAEGAGVSLNRGVAVGGAVCVGVVVMVGVRVGKPVGVMISVLR